MNERLRKLYQDVILRHSREPYHFGKQEDLKSLEAYNPLCGDKYHLYLRLDEEILTKLFFHGYGCSISKASTSVLVQKLEGRSRIEAQTIVQLFLDILSKDVHEEGLVIPDDFQAFEAARLFPARLKCASLSWEVMLHYLNGNEL